MAGLEGGDAGQPARKWRILHVAGSISRTSIGTGRVSSNI